MGASGGPTEPTAASTDTEELLLVGASSAVAVQAVPAAKGSYDDGVGTVGAYVINSSELGSSQQDEGVVGLAPEEEVAVKLQQAELCMTCQALSKQSAAG